MLLGLFISAFGASVAIKARLGTSPVACCPVVYAAPLGVSVGMSMFLFNVIFLLAQIALERREFPLFHLLQLIPAMLFGSLTDLTTILIGPLPAEGLPLRIAYCAVSIVMVGMGVFLLLRANLLMMCTEAFDAVVSRKTGVEYGIVKIIKDVLLVCIAAAGSLIIDHRLVHVGFGTAAAAVFVGMVVRWLKRDKRLNGLIDRVLG